METRDETSAVLSEPMDRAVTGTPYDDVFRTLLTECPELVIPLVNEAFGEHYSRDAEVTVHHNEFFIGSNEKRVTDSHISIGKKKYHAECQSTADGTLMIRLFEYDAQIAIEDAEQRCSEVVFTFPYTTVLYLRCSRNTPSRMRVTIRVPGDSAGYEVPVVKVPEYTLEEIMEKELFFLLPFHLFRYEKNLGMYEKDGERLEELRDTYRRIVSYLDRKVEERKLTAIQRWVIRETTRKVAENLAVHHRKVREGVTEVMGGQILELECVKQWNAGKAEGMLEGLSALVRTLKPILNDIDKVYEAVRKNETYADVTREKVMEYF